MKKNLATIFFITVMLFALCSCSGEKTPTKCKVHDFYEETIVKNSSCNEEGIAERVCKVCGAKETRTIPALTVEISSVLSDPFDTSEQMKRTTNYNSDHVYYTGNFYVARNSANGNMLQWGFQNLSNKTIKYITFTVYYYNAVGDLVEDNISGKTSGTFKITGPIDPKENVMFRDVLMYSKTCTKFYISDVKIEYMDGTIVSGKYNKATERFRVI